MRLLPFLFSRYRHNTRHHQMAVKLLAVYCLLAPGYTVSIKAQITIGNTVFPAVGDTLHFAFGNQPGAINQIYTPPGGNQQWDLGNLQPTLFEDQVMKNPQTGSESASFPGASVLINPFNSSDQNYLQVTGSQVNDMGYFGLDELGLGVTLLFKKSPGLEQSWAPVNFFDIHQSTSTVLTGFDAPLAPPFLLSLVPTADSFRIRITYQRIGVIDAWGTLTIPGGTFEVLRKKQTEYQSKAMDVKVAPLGWIDISTIGGQQVIPLGTDTITTFHFLNNISKEPIAICTLNTAQNAVTDVRYKVAVTVGTGDLVPGSELFRMNPNPAHDAVTLRYELPDAADVRVVVSDVAGRQLFMLLNEHQSAGSQVTRHALPPMQPGLHFVQVFTDDKLQFTAKLFIL